MGVVHISASPANRLKVHKMRLHTLKLTDFRNHTKFETDFHGESALLVGPNGSGKSNILEAIHLLATTKSLRTTYDRELINHNAEFARVGASAAIDDDLTTLEMVITKSKINKNASTKTVKINKVNKSLNAFAGTLNSVLFTPTDIEILAGSPSLRRKYIDSIFFQIDKDYKRTHSLYSKAVRQRNKVLEKVRDGLAHEDQLAYWDEKILELGSNLQRKRKDLFLFMQEHIGHYTKLLNLAEIDYKVNYNQSKLSHARIIEHRNAEIASKSTLIGPHRDDFSIEYDGFDIAAYGSRGQQRTTILAIKLCEIDYITQTIQKRPILLLDDIFSELDSEHREAINSIISLQQTFITTALDAGNKIEITTLAS